MPVSPITVNVDTGKLAQELRAEAEVILNSLLKIPADHGGIGVGRLIDCLIGAAALRALNTLASAEEAHAGSAPKARSWYSTCGALVTDQPVPGVAEDPLTPEEGEFYGAPYLVAESMTEQAAETLSKLLGLNYCGAICNEPRQRRTMTNHSPLLGLYAQQDAAEIESLVLSLRQLASYQHSDVSIAEDAADLIIELAYACSTLQEDRQRPYTHPLKDNRSGGQHAPTPV